MGFQLTPQRAWMLGAVLTDGYLRRDDRYALHSVCLSVCDRDFAEAFTEACEGLVGFRYKVSEQKPQTARHKPQWLVQATDMRIYAWVLEQTEAKTVIPKGIISGDRELQRHFLAGVMDGDGWVTVAQQRIARKDGHRGWYCQIGLASTSPWLYELKRMTDAMGLPSKGPTLMKRNNPNWNPIYQLRFDVEPFIAEQVPLRIVRKRERLDGLWRDLESSEAIRSDPDYDRGKRWSEPVGDYGSSSGTETGGLAASQ